MSKVLFGLVALAPAVMGNVMNEKAAQPQFHVSTNENARTCSTPVLSAEEISISEKDMRQALNKRKKSREVYVKSTVIDVYYHIITCSNGDGSLTDQQLADQMTVMNDAYAGSGFSFVEAGRNVVVNDAWCSGLSYNSAEETAMKQALRQGDGTALNFYTAGLGNSLLGWATFPNSYSGSAWRDGVVNLYSSLPGAGSGPYSLGMTAVHEVGHWLGLYHTFQGGCGTSGDLVADTPEVSSPNYGCPGAVDSCPSDGQGNDMTNNFMDYTNDACMDAFTDGQRTRMLDQFNAFRLGTACTINCGPSPSASPTISPAPTTIAEMCVDVEIVMTDSWGDGWNGNYLYFDTVANIPTTDLKVTLASGSSGTASLCLPPGTYYPFACSGTWVNEVSWSLPAYGVSGGASSTCGNGAQTLVVLPPGTSMPPTHSPTPAPTPAPTSNPTLSPTLAPNVHVRMQDSYGDGWNGNYLYFGDHSSSSTVKVTLPSGSDSTVGLSLPPGVYSPYACHGSWDGEITWTIVESGLSGGADNSCSPTSGSFTVNAQGNVVSTPPSSAPTMSPTPAPTPAPPTAAPTQCNVVVHMADSYGDGWNGNKLYFDDVANMATTEYKMTFSQGHAKTKSICLPPGVYAPFACGGGWPHEVSWEIEGYGISGGASSACAADNGQFTVLAEGQTVSPTVSPTSAPTEYPSAVPTSSPTVQSLPTVAPTPLPTAVTTPSPTPTGGAGECCCDEKINQVLANQATMITSLSSDVLSGDGSADSEESSSSTSSSSSGKVTLESTSVIVGTVLCATLLSAATIVAVYYRKKVQALEDALGRHAPLGSLELGGGAY